MKPKQIRVSLIAFFVCFFSSGVSKAESKFPVKIIFNNCCGLLCLDEPFGGGYFKIVSPDSTFYLSPGRHVINIGNEKDTFWPNFYTAPWHASPVSFLVDPNGLIYGAFPSGAFKISEDKKSLSFNTEKVKIELADYKGKPLLQSKYAKLFRRESDFYILPEVNYLFDNGFFRDSTNNHSQDNPFFPYYLRQRFWMDGNGKLNFYNAKTGTSPQKGVLRFKTVTFKACPCHFGDGYLIFPNKPKDTIRHWTNITLIAAIPTEIIIVDAKGNKEVNYFYPPHKGVLKRKDMLRKKK